MDMRFVAKVPDLTRWGTIRSIRHDIPRPHQCTVLDINIRSGSSGYSMVIKDIAQVIAFSRLNDGWFATWEQAIAKKITLTELQKKAISAALSKGICKSGSDPVKQKPTWIDKDFKGHLVEVILFCIRAYLGTIGPDKARVFIPIRPKANPRDNGIDLLEFCENSDKYYYIIWECKGTEIRINSAFNKAAKQLSEYGNTAYQNFMESYLELSQHETVLQDPERVSFVSGMPDDFYGATPAECKRIGGVVCSQLPFDQSEVESFAGKISTSTFATHINCQVVNITVENFMQFRSDIYDTLWNIY